MTAATLAVIAVLIVASPFINRFLLRSDIDQVGDQAGPIIATLLKQVQESTAARVSDLEQLHEDHLAVVAELNELWAKRLADTFDAASSLQFAAIEHERDSIKQLLEWNRLERLDDVRARIATQAPGAVAGYGGLSRVDMLREPSDVGERTVDLEEERLTPWKARRRAGQAAAQAETRGSVDEYRDVDGEPIIPVGAGG